MKKILASVLCVLVLLSAAACLSGCGSKYVGRWEAKRAKYLAVEVDLTALGETKLILELDKDGTARVISDGESAVTRWEETGKGIRIYDSTDGAVSLEFTRGEHGELYVEYQGAELVLEKTDQ